MPHMSSTERKLYAENVNDSMLYLFVVYVMMLSIAWSICN
jgi:hypothetical protein